MEHLNQSQSRQVSEETTDLFHFSLTTFHDAQVVDGHVALADHLVAQLAAGLFCALCGLRRAGNHTRITPKSQSLHTVKLTLQIL